MAKLDETSIETLFGDSDKTAAETKGGGGNFIKLADGESAVLVFEKRKPVDYKEVWNPTSNRSEFYNETEHDGMRPRGKFMFSVCTVTPDGLEPGLLDVGAEVYGDIKAELIKRGFESAFEFLRKGEGKETKYRFSFEDKLTDEQLEAVAAVEFLSPEEALAQKTGGAAPSGGGEKKKNPWGK